MSRQPLQGKVAQLLNERQLVINIGAKHRVQVGTKFAILATPAEIHDPDTGESLGIIPREKVRVKATTVEEQYTVCTTYQTKVVGGGAFYDVFAGLALGSPRREIPVTLKAGEEQFLPPLEADESYVKIGDVVQEIVEGEEP